ncbi:GNAT family N-acetyltransferase [Mangrovicoccus sp. HB161399]|uniref:GNAT family N-acetyltransferase n=1 Tax=Mangrovicoccus sp. HB161399 TaxID=2720392 RepID=UPI00155613B9|nr:GNAT family N-acetyltransferase [Mangrovicoccus sp. HB161399]
MTATETTSPSAPRGVEMAHGPATTGLAIRVDSPLSADGLALVHESQAALLEHSAEDEIFSLDPEELAAPNIAFFVARLNGMAAGCVALVDMGSYGEIKRLFVRPGARGHGIAEALMAELESYAADIGLGEVRLESSTDLKAAERFYRRSGYADCQPFGGYPVLSHSLFMSRRFGAAA